MGPSGEEEKVEQMCKMALEVSIDQAIMHALCTNRLRGEDGLQTHRHGKYIQNLGLHANGTP